MNKFKRKKNFIYKKNKNKVEISFRYDQKNWNFLLINTGLNTQTGGRINKIKKFITKSKSDDFFLTYADGLSNINLNNLYNFHKKEKSQSTVSIVKIKNQYGVVETKNNKVLSFTKYDKDIWESDCIPRIMKKYTLNAYIHRGFWQSMDSFHDKIKLDNYLKNNPNYFTND